MIKQKAHVVIQTAFLGDLILSIPLFKRLKNLFPDTALIVVCKKGLGDFLLKEKLVDHYFEVTKGDKKSYKKVLAELKNFLVKNVYCVHRSIRSLFFASQIHAEKKIGFSSLLGFWIFDDQIDFAQNWPEPLRILKVLETTDTCCNQLLSSENWEKLNKTNGEGFLPPVPAQFSFNHNLQLTTRDRKIALFPGSVWATKKWTKEGFAEVARFFLADGYTVDLMGGPDEMVLCEEIALKAPGANVLAGQLSVAESLRKVREHVLVICNDSASTHMAAYQNTPVLSIFGPTTLELGFRPWSDDAVIVENKNLDCRPCGKHGHQKCPLGHHHCMNQISAVSVIDSAFKLLRSAYSA